MFTAAPIAEDVFPKIDAIVEKHGADPDALIEILHGVQEEVGYLPQHVQEYIANRLSMPPGQVESVISFYSFFTTIPRGRHIIKVCQGTACYVRGGKRVLEEVVKRAGCGVGETSEDMRFSVDVVRCVGACGLSPVMTIGDDIYERVKPSQVNDLLARYE
ncbi:MAG: NAD(P)H-dependent oxidoreductase subunit E [Acidobacteriota bacterium]|nr:NAD(P)H-dependent oxidoreductase subunit E [Acidobacteriota bacterium]